MKRIFVIVLLAFIMTTACGSDNSQASGGPGAATGVWDSSEWDNSAWGQ